MFDFRDGINENIAFVSFTSTQMIVRKKLDSKCIDLLFISGENSQDKSRLHTNGALYSWNGVEKK